LWLLCGFLFFFFVFFFFVFCFFFFFVFGALGFLIVRFFGFGGGAAPGRKPRGWAGARTARQTTRDWGWCKKKNIIMK
ncbi:hypothetical protein ACSTIZ_00910, partial [Vibrio parahaemolyticus]